MESWSNNSKKAVYYITFALTILFPIVELVFFLINMIKWLNDFEEISSSATVSYFIIVYMLSIIVYVLYLLYRIALIVITILRHYKENAFFKVYPIVAYSLSVVVRFHVIIGMSFSTLSASFPFPGIGLVTIPPEEGRIVLISFFVYIAMVILSGINVKAKNLL